MTLPLPRNARPLAAFAALAWTALAFGAAVAPQPAYAADGAFYRAQLAAPATKAQPISSGIAWRCGESACTAGKGTSRPVIVCARLAKDVGKVSAFVADGKALEAADLAKCNGE